MKNQGLFSTLFIKDIQKETELDDMGEGRMATLTHAWQACNRGSADDLWESFVKQAVSYNGVRGVPYTSSSWNLSPV